VWTTLCGVESDHPLTYYTVSGLVTGESWYFRYSVRNAVGWSEVSPVMFTEIGVEPAQMTAPTVVFESDPTLIKISWLELSIQTNGGLGIDRYLVEILAGDTTYRSTPSCDGSTPEVISKLECSIPLTVLLEEPL
jgi:hypothetical protein